MAVDLELHIEELVLEGFSRADQLRLTTALEGELRRLVAERGLPPGVRDQAAIAQLDGGAIELRPGMRAEAIGVELARSVYEGLTR